MNSDGQVVVVHAVQNKQGQVGFFVESAAEDTRRFGTNCGSKNGGTDNMVEYAKKCFSDYERAVESTTERLKKNPVLQMYYNNPPNAQNGCGTNGQFKTANNMIFCRSPFHNQVWYRFRSEGGSAFQDDVKTPTGKPAETSNDQRSVHSAVQANVREPVAYNLTFVPVSKSKKKKLPEIRVLVPTSDDELEKHHKKKRIPAEDKTQQGDEGKMGRDETKQDGEDKSRHSNEDKSKNSNKDKSRHRNEDRSRLRNEDRSGHSNEDSSRQSNEGKLRPSNEDKSRPSNEDKSRHSNEDKSRHSNEEKSRHSNEDKSRHSNEDKSRYSNEEPRFSIEVKVKNVKEDTTEQEEEKLTARTSRGSRDRKRSGKDDVDRKKTLQEYLRANRPDFIERADKRKQCLADLALLRNMRKQKYLELLELNRKLRLKNEARERRARTRTRSEARRRARMQRKRKSSSSTSCSSSYWN